MFLVKQILERCYSKVIIAHAGPIITFNRQGQWRITHCNGHVRACPLASGIRTADNALCIRPESGGCNAEDGTLLTLHADGCDGADSKFEFDISRGLLVHACSGKKVCTIDGSSSRGKKVVVNSNCHFSETQRFLRTFSKFL